MERFRICRKMFHWFGDVRFSYSTAQYSFTWRERVDETNRLRSIVKKQMYQMKCMTVNMEDLNAFCRSILISIKILRMCNKYGQLNKCLNNKSKIVSM